MRRLLTGLLVTLLVLGGLGAVGDELLRSEAEKRVATTLAARLGTTPDVQAHGWPFCAMLLTHRLPGAQVRADQISGHVDGQQVSVTDLLVEADSITNPTDLDQAKVGRVVVHGTADWATLSRRLDLAVSDGGGGRMKVATTVAGQQVELVGQPVIAGDGLSFSNATGTLGGKPLDQGLVEAAVMVAQGELQLPRVEGFTLSDVEVVEGGLRVGLVGNDVAVSRFR
ncbi:MAG TPA: DUF2993 domain-containing protein [Candidatus Luteococcus avicola]|nr:DUF2993 domain-containing protein [Candidatus Luteococcus avicola]